MFVTPKNLILSSVFEFELTGTFDGSMFLFGSLDFLVSMGIHLPEEISQLVDFPSPEGGGPSLISSKNSKCRKLRFHDDHQRKLGNR